MKYRIAAMIMLLFCACQLFAQQTASEKGIELLKKMTDRYNSNNYLRFDMEFRYSAESDPGKYLDSMKGTARIDGKRYSYNLGNTNLIKTDNYMISIFSEEKIIQLIRLQQSDSSSPMESAGISSSMINALDSMQQKDQVKITAAENAGQYIVTLQFSAHPSWKSVEYVIRKKDDFLERTTIVAKMEEMLGPGLQGMDLVQGYAIIETIFSGYDTGKPDPALLQNESYFTQHEGSFEPVAAYKDYRIMLVQ